MVEKFCEWESVGGNNDNSIGANCHLYRNVTIDDAGKRSEKTIMVDLGNMFAKEDKNPGDQSTTFLLPGTLEMFPNRFNPSFQPAEKIDALVITHGHLDHIGAIAHMVLLGCQLPTLYASPMTANMIKSQLSTSGVPVNEWPEIKIMQPGATLDLAGFGITPYYVSHSIPHAMCLEIETAAGQRIFHSGDMKIDQEMLCGPVTNMAELTAIGDKGVDVMLMDSTRANMPGLTPNEGDVTRELTKIFAENPNQDVFIAVMGTHFTRIMEIAKAERDRLIASGDLKAGEALHVNLLGGSVNQTVLNAKTAGIDPEKIIGGPVVFHSIRDRREIGAQHNRAVVICTGTQGEQTAAMPRLSRNDYRGVKLTPKDLVIISASTIPGNEEPVDRMLKGLHRIGCRVITNKDRVVHTSGHAPAEDIKKIVGAIRPKNYLPIHGSAMHLDEHAKLITAEGYQVTKVANGCRVRIDANGISASPTSKVPFIKVKSTGTMSNPFFKYSLIAADGGESAMGTNITLLKQRGIDPNGGANDNRQQGNQPGHRNDRKKHGNRPRW